MNYSKVLITGASGFIGSRLCEKFTLEYAVPYRALVRNFGRAARIARLGAEMIAGDVADPDRLDEALAGCDAVVHLAFDGAVDAEAKLVAACRRARIRRLIHISSMAVHGPNPGPECAHERTASIGHYNEKYSDSKARAERVISAAIRAGLPAVILRPTIVYGPYSPFVMQVIQSARTGVVTLIDEGKGACNAVYVDDVCDAIYASLHCEEALGKAFFVNADKAISWKAFNLTFANMVSPPPLVRSVTASEVRAYWQAQKPSVWSNATSLRRLIASQTFHDQLETVPAFKTAIRWAKVKLKKILSADQVVAIKAVAGGEAKTASSSMLYPDLGRVVREDFHLAFSNEFAKTELGWKPVFDFAAGAELTRAWLDFAEMLERAS